ncbi:MAG: SDR family NAD(P)-dependent oxidoreductase [Bacteroidetes bacterium]|nr:SDR family NAD(P)-dependent oxidoreductase [Bacteroidota bacterium]
MRIDLSSKVVLVTGASRGIGNEIARQMASAGATVAVHYSNSPSEADALCNEIGHGAKSFRADLADAGAAIRLFDAVVAHFGHIDVLVNNAGIAELAPINSSNEDWITSWDRTFNVNTRSSGILTKCAIDHFRSRGGGRIIYIASRAAFRGDSEDYLAYAASKGAMVALARSVARGFGKDGIVAFVIAPGFVRTAMAQDAIDAYGEEFVLGGVALNRLTEPSDVAPMIVLLASGLADHATGCSIDINAASYVR